MTCCKAPHIINESIQVMLQRLPIRARIIGYFNESTPRPEHEAPAIDAPNFASAFNP
jgi:hypothetical protein